LYIYGCSLLPDELRRDAFGREVLVLPEDDEHFALVCTLARVTRPCELMRTAGSAALPLFGTVSALAGAPAIGAAFASPSRLWDSIEDNRAASCAFTMPEGSGRHSSALLPSVVLPPPQLGMAFLTAGVRAGPGGAASLAAVLALVAVRTRHAPR
jgi:hypothetical protein